MERALTTLEFLRPARPVSGRLFAGFVAYLVLAPALVHHALPLEPLRDLQDATGGWITATLVLSIPFFAILWAVLIRAGGQRWSDLGLIRAHVLSGGLITAAFWVLTQAIQAGGAAVDGDAPALHARWGGSLGVPIGLLLGQLLANGPYEEMIFRRFMLSQTSHVLAFIRPAFVRLVVVVLLTQLFFWVMHFPAVLAKGGPASHLVSGTSVILVNGFLFTWAYLQTRNLFVAVGFHALANRPTSLFVETFQENWLVQRLGVALLVLHLVVLSVRRRARPPAPSGT